MSEVVAALQQSSSARQTSLSIQPSVGTGSSSDVLTFLRNASLNTIHKPKPGKKGLGPRPGRTTSLSSAPIAAAFLGLAILAGIIFKMQTKDGTLVVEVNQPDAVVQVINEEGKVEITRPGEKGTISISVDPGKHRLKVEKDGFQFFTKDFTMESGGKQSIKAVLEPLKVAAMPAIAPFDATTARKHQEAWAKHLGLPVEITNSIGMKLVLIPPGEFRMGSPKELIEEELKAHDNDQWYKDHLPGEGPQHRVRITRPFYLGMYVVTQQEYQRVMGTNPSEFSATGKSKDKVAGQDTKRFPVEMCVVGRCGGVLPKAIGDAGGEGGGANVSTAFGGAVGVCVSCGEHRSVQLQFGRQCDSQGVRRERAFRLRVVQGQFWRNAARSGREAAERMGIV